MQAAQCLAPAAILTLPNTQNKCFFPPPPPPPPPPSFKLTSISFAKCKTAATTSTDVYETSTVDYTSLTSVFPVEACEIIGGDACNVDMFPEVKLPLQPQQLNNQLQNTAQETVEREYLEYNGLKTVFLEEACDNLGGEFCYPGYLREPTY